MDPRALEQHFRAFAAQAGIALAQSTALVGFSCMLRFFEQERASGCDFDDDADMLLFQWGVYDWGRGMMFEVDLTRQVILPDESDDEAIWQLHLTYRYTPRTEFAAIGKGNRWCHALADLPAFEAFVTTCPPLALVASLAADEVVVEFECAG